MLNIHRARGDGDDRDAVRNIQPYLLVCFSNRANIGKIHVHRNVLRIQIAQNRRLASDLNKDPVWLYLEKIGVAGTGQKADGQPGKFPGWKCGSRILGQAKITLDAIVDGEPDERREHKGEKFEPKVVLDEGAQ